MSKDEVFPSILFIYELVPEQTHTYLIPADTPMSVNLRKAIIGINGLMVNVSDNDENDKVWKHWAYVNAAITENAEHLDNENAYNANRFHALLLPFKLPDAVIGGQTLIDLNGPLLLVRAGVIM